MSAIEKINEQRQKKIAKIRKAFIDLRVFFDYYDYQKDALKVTSLYDSIRDRLENLEQDNPSQEVK